MRDSPSFRAPGSIVVTGDDLEFPLFSTPPTWA
jgi:hypothetical protein